MIIINGNEGVEQVGGAKIKRYCHIPIVQISSETLVFGSLKRIELYCLIIMIIIALKPEGSYIYIKIRLLHPTIPCDGVCQGNVHRVEYI